MNENDAEVPAEQQPEALTIETVRNRVEYGTYIAKLPTGPSDKCRSYKVLQKIYEQDGTEIKHFYRCTCCGNYLMVAASNGTGPLNRHVDEQCEALSPDVRRAARAKRLGHSNKSKETPVPKQVAPDEVNRDVVARTDVINISVNEMAMALSKATEIGFRYGSKNADFFTAILEPNKNKWY